MTYQGDNLRHDCRRLRRCKLDDEPALSWVNAAMPGRVEGSDIDWFVEVGGRFLFIEYKGVKGDLEGGQYRALKRLGDTPPCTVLVLRDRLDGDLDVKIFDGQPTTRWKSATHDEVQAWLRDWSADELDGPFVTAAGSTEAEVS